MEVFYLSLVQLNRLLLLELLVFLVLIPKDGGYLHVQIAHRGATCGEAFKYADCACRCDSCE